MISYDIGINPNKEGVTLKIKDDKATELSYYNLTEAEVNQLQSDLKLILDIKKKGVDTFSMSYNMNK